MARRKTPIAPPAAASPRRGQIDYRTERGWFTSQLADVAQSLTIHELLPCRLPIARRTQSNMPGWYYSHTANRRLAYESVNERHHLVRLDLDPTVTSIATQPFRIWVSSKIPRCPDIVLERSDAQRSVVQVTTSERLDKSKTLRERLDQEAALFRGAGWGFDVVTDQDLSAQEIHNLQWFASFRRPALFNAEIAEQLLDQCAQTRPIYEILRAVDLYEDDARPVLFHLIAVGYLTTDLQAPITNLTPVTPGPLVLKPDDVRDSDAEPATPEV